VSGRQRLGLRRGDAGLSLVELLITMLVAGIVLPLVTGALILAQGQARSTLDAADSVDAVRLALYTVGRQVRSGQPATIPDAMGFRFYTARSTTGAVIAGQCVEYRIFAPVTTTTPPTPGTLKSRTWVPTAQPPAWTAPSVLTLATGVLVGAGAETRVERPVVEQPEPEAAAVRLVLEVQASAKSRTTITSVFAARNRQTTASADPCAPTT